MSRRVPDSMPVLTRGKHKRPRHGACLMEYVSVLSGGPFTDEPACTDPTLATIARAVNDCSGDETRQRLAVLASDLSVAGRVDVRAQQELARRCLLTALPYASGTRRRVLIVGLLGLERAAAGATKGYHRDQVSVDTELALLGSEGDVREAVERLEELPVSVQHHYKRGLAASIEMAIATISEEAADSDELLYRLLVSCLDDHRSGLARTRIAARGDRDGVAARGELAE
jgi:hypothetical protein